MPFSHREFNAFIHANEFCRLLYDFLEDNQDQALYKDNDDCKYSVKVVLCA